MVIPQGGSDFLANSFFDVFVDVDIPGLGTLYNDEALVVDYKGIDGIPPKVTYVHGNSTLVPLHFLTDGPAWHAGDVFGNVILAGHGINMNINDPGDVARFQTDYSHIPTMPVPEPSTCVAGLAACLMLLGAAMRRGRR